MRDIAKLKNAELLFKFSLAVSGTCTASNMSPFTYLSWFTFLGHTASEDELHLTLPQEKWAAVVFEHVAIHLMAVQIDTALEAKFGTQRFDNSNGEIRSACRIARLIRNAFAHDPFSPVWKFKQGLTSQKYQVSGILSLDLTGLEGHPVKREDYGGPLALLRFLQFTMRLVESSGTLGRFNPHRDFYAPSRTGLVWPALGVNPGFLERNKISRSLT